MTDTAKTTTFVGVALALVLLAYIAQPRISRDPGVFDDVREPFYAELIDPDVPKAMEVVEFNEELGTQNPFRVQLKDGRWTIPSHHDYPADAEDRLKKTAGAIIGLRKDSIVSDSKADFAALGVVDPFESQKDSTGWGTRVKLFDKDGNVVSDLIFGNAVPDKPNFRYVRVPGKDRTYAVDVKDLELSIKFADWIDTDLIAASSADFDEITIKDYRVDPQRGTIDDKGTTELAKNDKDSQWKVDGIAENEETNQQQANGIAQAIADLKVVGVRVKPPGLSPDLRAPEGVQQALNMQSRGFYLLQSGDLVSNDGEVISETKDGLVYTLRFGNMILGSGDEVTAGTEDEKGTAPEEKAAEPKEGETKEGEAKKPESVQENRFLLISVAFDEKKFPPIPDLPTEEPKEEKADPTSAQEEAKTEEAPAEKAAETPVSDAPAAEAKPEEAKAEEPTAEAKPTETAPEVKEGEAKPAEKSAEEQAKEEAAAKEAEAKVKEAERKMKEEELKRKREERERKIKEGQEKAKELSDRYARWYYVVPNDAVKKIRVPRAELVQVKKAEGEGSEAAPGDGVVPMPPVTEEPAAADPAQAEEPASEANTEDKPADAKPEENADSEGKAAEPKAEDPPAEPKAEEPPAEEKPAAPEPKAEEAPQQEEASTTP